MRRMIMTFLLATVLAAAAACAQEEGENWTCPDCGRVNTTRFCTYCGQARPERIVCPGCGKIRRMEDGSGDIRYICSDNTGTLQLDYYTENGAVCRISMQYIP